MTIPGGPTIPREGVGSKNGFREYREGWRTDKLEMVSIREKKITRATKDRGRGW